MPIDCCSCCVRSRRVKTDGPSSYSMPGSSSSIILRPQFLHHLSLEYNQSALQRFCFDLNPSDHPPPLVYCNSAKLKSCSGKKNFRPMVSLQFITKPIGSSQEDCYGLNPSNSAGTRIEYPTTAGYGIEKALSQQRCRVLA